MSSQRIPFSDLTLIPATTRDHLGASALTILAVCFLGPIRYHETVAQSREVAIEDANAWLDHLNRGGGLGRLSEDAIDRWIDEDAGQHELSERDQKALQSLSVLPIGGSPTSGIFATLCGASQNHLTDVALAAFADYSRDDEFLRDGFDAFLEAATDFEEAESGDEFWSRWAE